MLGSYLSFVQVLAAFAFQSRYLAWGTVEVKMEIGKDFSCGFFSHFSRSLLDFPYPCRRYLLVPTIVRNSLNLPHSALTVIAAGSHSFAEMD